MQGFLGTIAALAPTIAMLAVFALVAGGVHLIRTRRNRRKGGLMLVLAAVLFGNVLLLTL